MNTDARQASKVIDSVAKAVANWTADEHERENPDLPNRYGSAWRPEWTDHTLSQIHMLAQAVAVRSTDLFVHHVCWTYDSFEARGIQGADLIQNTNCMRNVLARELPPPVAQAVLPFVDTSIAEMQSADRKRDADPPLDARYRERTLEYLKAILEGDRTAAESLILATLDEGTTIAEVYEGIVAPAQARLGRMWHRGEISVADEHFGSATTQSVMSLLRPRFAKAKPNRRILVATSTPGDLHEIGLRMVSDLFEIDGWSVIYLGANTPTAALVELLDRRQPNLLALSVSTGLTLRDAGELIETIRGTGNIANMKILIGGPPFTLAPDLWRELGADGYAASCTEAVKLGNRLVAC
ncbi:MAG: cobalamin-dependent protein [Phycisphaerae bacterium]|jgi:methanogenic corrinoid protein MtbC1